MIRPQRPTLRLLHTSDIHLGDDINPGQRAISLQAVVDTALRHQVDAVLVAGDLFDHSRVRPLVVEAAIQELRRLRQPAIIIPGNHDCVDSTSIYRRIDLRQAGEHVHFVGEPQGRLLVFEEKRLAVWARGIEEHSPDHQPLRGYQPADASYWRVILTHGHYVEGGDESYRSSQIKEEEIAALQCDYLALGHWHRYLDVSANGVAAFYSGSPGERGEDSAPTVNLVTLDEVQGVSVQRVPLEGVGAAPVPPYEAQAGRYP